MTESDIATVNNKHTYTKIVWPLQYSHACALFSSEVSINLSSPVLVSSAISAYEEDRLYDESLLVNCSLLLLLLLLPLLLLWVLFKLALISTGPICYNGGGLGNSVSTAIGKIPPVGNRSGDEPIYYTQIGKYM